MRCSGGTVVQLRSCDRKTHARDRFRESQGPAAQCKSSQVSAAALYGIMDARCIYIKNLPNQPSTCSLDAIYSYCLRLRSVATAAAHGKRRRVRPIRARRRGEAGRLDAVRQDGWVAVGVEQQVRPLPAREGCGCPVV